MYGVSHFGQVIVLGLISVLQTVINVMKHIQTAKPIWVASSIYLDKEGYSTKL